MGYYQYHAVPGNLDRLRIFGQRLRRLWRLVLSRRSEGGMLPWDRVTPIFNCWIPIARVLHLSNGTLAFGNSPGSPLLWAGMSSRRCRPVTLKSSLIAIFFRDACAIPNV